MMPKRKNSCQLRLQRKDDGHQPSNLLNRDKYAHTKYASLCLYMDSNYKHAQPHAWGSCTVQRVQ